MEQSLFSDLVAKYFGPIVTGVAATYNGEAKLPSYLHKTMLRKEYSVTGNWESLSAINSLVTADVVAMDASLPLKSRDAISSVQGEICKLGMEMALNESQLTKIDAMIAMKKEESAIIAQVFRDVDRCIGGINEKLEYMFLQGLSEGVTSTTNADNTGQEIRIDYGYKNENKFGVTALWSDPVNAKPIDDIAKVLTKADTDGVTVRKLVMDKSAFDNMLKTAQFKDQYGVFAGFAGAIPNVSNKQALEVLKDRFDVEVEVVNRKIVVEKNGVRSTITPFAQGRIVFLPDTVAGDLVYADLAEKNHPVKNVDYQLVDDFILVSKYHKISPLREMTSSQARVVPVLTNTAQVYTLDTKTVQA